ncbi:MAG TPA: helix-turn-helix domain-containing protein [Solirubrobacteraceae bacterium]|jgi:AcrR family transcriptional regulator|nr:helix-turn-helix domain-containing protein [Solirubrobacteraceae bacterium]
MVVAVEKRAQRPAVILAAALESFAEQGFAATTIEEIRERSGASIGSIYHHFGGKEGLAAELYVDGLREYQAGFVRALESHPGAEAGIHALVRHHLGWVEHNPQLAQFLANRRETELRNATEARVRELNRAFLPRVAAWVERHVEMGALRALPFDLWEPVLLGPSQELARQWLAGRTRITLREAERDLAETTWRAVKGERS